MVAETILRQLGGKRLIVMTGAYDFLRDGDYTLMFKFKGSKKANFVKITLNSLDLYDVEFLKVSNLTPKKALKWIDLTNEEVTAKLQKNKKTFNNVYCDQLIEIFESHTGLYLTL